MTTFLSASRAGSVTTRMGPDLRTVIEQQPGIGGISLWVRFADVETSDIAYTDGHCVCAGRTYLDYTTQERAFFVQHELLHVALQHPARARALAQCWPDFDFELYNVCTDAVINAALAQGLHATQPPKSIDLKTVLTGAKLWDEGMTYASALATYSSDALYMALRTHQQATGKTVSELAGGLEPGQTGPTFSGDLRPDREERTEAERNDDARSWEYRTRQALAGSPGLLRALIGELPKVTTPWERRLRAFCFRYCAVRSIGDPHRPSRRWSALETPMRVRERVELPFECGRRPGRSTKLAIGLDTSGSVDDGMLRRFGGEIASIMSQTGASVRLIVCDDRVHQIEDLQGHSGIRRLRTLSYRGGGGTDFRPAIAAAQDAKVDAMVFLTDLCGTAGAPPPFPMLWAVPLAFSGTAVPYGSHIVLR